MDSQDLFVVEKIISLEQVFFQILVESFLLDVVSRFRFDRSLSLFSQIFWLSWFNSIFFVT